MNELERYLQKATRGLWGRKKLEVWRELEANVNLRVDELQLEGLSREQGLAKALAEMGSAGELGAGMRGVYVLPKVVRFSPLAMLMLCLSLLTFAPIQAQLNPTTLRDYKSEERPILVETEALKAEMEKQGVPFRILQTKVGGLRTSEAYNVNGGGHIGLTVQQDGRSYVALDTLISTTLENTGKKGKLEGWDVLKFSFGSFGQGRKPAQLTFGSSQSPINPYTIYVPWVLQALREKLTSKAQWHPTFLAARSTEMTMAMGRCTHTVKVNAPAGTVFGLIGGGFFDLNTPNPYQRVLDLAPVKSDGTVDLEFPHPRLEFISSLNFLDDPNPRHSISADGLPNAEVVMLRLTGEISLDKGTSHTVYTPQTKESNVPLDRCS